jgi:excisionase family DNA binding protein
MDTSAQVSGEQQYIPFQNVIAEDSWCTISAAAQYLSVSVPFLRKAVRFNKVPFARVGAKAVRFRRSDLDRWLRTNDPAFKSTSALSLTGSV